MATALGTRLLTRFAMGDATVEQMDAALSHGWITSEEHDAALAASD